MTPTQAPQQQIVVHLFGPQARLVGADQVCVPVEPGTTLDSATLRRRLGELAPALRPSLSASRLAVNQEYALKDQPIGPQDEVALIGMVSGG